LDQRTFIRKTLKSATQDCLGLVWAIDKAQPQSPKIAKTQGVRPCFPRFGNDEVGSSILRGNTVA
jgi:hypothetical protein